MIVLADPSIASNNLGDQIITKYVFKEISQLFPNDEIVRYPTQLFTSSRRGSRLLGSSKAILIGGSNLLSGKFPRIHQWANMHQFARFSSKVHLFGCGWHSYESRVWPLNGLLLRSVLSPKLHSVRDGYTAQKLQSLDIDAIDTGCPTLWRLPSLIRKPSVVDRVICTLTYYRSDADRDRKLLLAISKLGESLAADVCFWPQSEEDLVYFKSLGVERSFTILDSTVSAFECSLAERTVYLGTRLHAGIHALNKSVYSLIIGIDNRAIELAATTNLPVVTEFDVSHWDCLEDIVVNVPVSAIADFKENLLSMYKS